VRIENISLRALTVGILLLLGLSSSVLSLVAGNHFRDAAFSSQIKTLSRVIEVASHEVVKRLRKQMVSVGFTIQKRGEFRDGLASVKDEGGLERLQNILDDPFITGFVGAADIELIRLRVYDLDLNRVAESRRGIDGLSEAMPEFLYQQAKLRKGSQRIKALGGLWISSVGPAYSVLVPVGGLHLKGYLEVVVDPLFNLSQVGEIIQMPLEIYSIEGETLYEGKAGVREVINTLPVDYYLSGDDKLPAYKLVAMEDVETLHTDMNRTQVRTTFGFLSLTVLSLLLALWLFSRFLFKPVRNMMDDIEKCTHGDLTATVGGKALKEFHALAGAFNTMMQKLRESIGELQRLSAQDGLTGIANRRQFDTSLEQEWKRALRNCTQVTLILMDIDFFKQYNDSYGHQSGDDCLKAVAGALSRVVNRPADLVARYGGEEFVVLLPETSLDGGIKLAGQIQTELAKLGLAHRASNVSNNVTLSMGVTTICPTEDDSPYTLVAEADDALYYAKDQGRNRIEVSERLRGKETE